MEILIWLTTFAGSLVQIPPGYIPYSWYPPLSYETSPAYIEVNSGQPHQIISKVKDRDQYLTSGEDPEIVVLCNSQTSVSYFITSGNISSITNSFDADTCWRTMTFVIIAHTLPPNTWEEYINSFTPIDMGNIQAVKDANGPTSTVTVRVNGPPPVPPDPPGGGG